MYNFSDPFSACHQYAGEVCLSEPEQQCLIWAKKPVPGEVFTREVLQYRESCDPTVSQPGIKVKTGWKWRAAKAVDAAETQLRHRALVSAKTRG